MSQRSKMKTFDDIRTGILNCRACYICNETGEPKPTPFDGPVDAKIMVCGRNPGINEKNQEIPFVGKGGKLLDQMLLWASIDRGSIYISNLVKCYSYQNRPLVSNEIFFCANRFLLYEVNLLKPKVIVPLGKDALFFFLGGHDIFKVHGKPFKLEKQDIVVFPLFHPGYLLRKPSLVFDTQKDMEALKKLIEII